MVNATSLAIEQSTFMNNTALTGGAVYMSRVTDTYIYDTYFYSKMSHRRVAPSTLVGCCCSPSFIQTTSISSTHSFHTFSSPRVRGVQCSSISPWVMLMLLSSLPSMGFWAWLA